MPTINLLIAYDSFLLAESLSLLLRGDASLRVCTRVTNSTGLIAALNLHRPDVVLMGTRLADTPAVDLMPAIRETVPYAAVLVLAGAREDDAIRALVRAGASGFVCTGSATGDELVQAIRAVHAGRSWLPRILTPAAMAPCSCLNKKEVEILNLVCCQKSSKQIADKVGLTRRSVEVYRKKINEKIGVVNAVGAALYAVKQGIFKV